MPGAFSAYNMKALFSYTEDDGKNEALLQDYFESISSKAEGEKIVETSISLLNAILRVVLPDFIH